MFFAMAKLPFFAQKNGEKMVLARQPKALWVLGVACGHHCPQLGMPHAMGGCKKWGSSSESKPEFA